MATPPEVMAQTVAHGDFMLDSLIIGLHLYTHHLDPELATRCGGPTCQQPYNSVNPGVYARTSGGWQAGLYRNSHRKPTVYAGRAWETSCGPIWCGAGVFAATGYPAGDVVPMATVSVRFGAVRLSYAPRVGDNASGIVHLSVEW